MAEMTKLSPDEEREFQSWMKSNPSVLQWKKEYKEQFGEDPEIDKSDYDYRKAWKEGLSPAPDEYDDNKMHWSSSTSSGELLKQEDHKTLWKEFFMRKFGTNPDKLRDEMVKEKGITRAEAEKILEQRLNGRPLLKESQMEND